MDRHGHVYETARAWKEEVRDAAAGLAALAELETAPAVLPLDLSYDSLARIERLVLSVVDGDCVVDRSRFRRLLTQYVGETLRTRLGGGLWDITREGGLPAIRRIPGQVAGYLYFPWRSIQRLAAQRWLGHLRREVEKHDLALTEARFAAFLQDVPGRAGRIIGLLDGSPAPGFDLASVAALEALLLDRPVAERAALAEDVTAFLGEVVRTVGGGRWCYPTDARDVNFDRFCIGGTAGIDPLATWDAANAVAAFRAVPERGTLVRVCLSAFPAARRPELTPNLEQAAPPS